MKTPRCLFLVLALVVCAAALGCDQPLTPTPPPPPQSGPPPGFVTATLSGQVIDADTGQPVVGAVVTIKNVTIGTPRGEVHSPDGVGTSAVTDAAGFRLEPLVRENSARITLSVSPPDGYEGNSEWLTQKFSPATPIEALVLSVYPTLIVRPGESIQTRVHLRHYKCGEEFVLPCRRVVIESAPGEPVEVELVPPTAPDNGLEHGTNLEFALHRYQRRVTASGGGEVYIVGGSSPVTLTARRP